MRVFIHDVDQSTGQQTLRPGVVDVHDMFDATDDGQVMECMDTIRRIEKNGEAWVGGGASPLVRLVRYDATVPDAICRTMTINELMAELRRLQRKGMGELDVYQHRYGDSYCMPVVRARAYGPGSYVVLQAANPALLWPNDELDAVCEVKDAMYDSMEDRDNVEYCRNSGGSM